MDYITAAKSNRWFTQCMPTVEYDANSRPRILDTVSSSEVGEQRSVHRGNMCTSLRDVMFVFDTESRKKHMKMLLFYQ